MTKKQYQQLFSIAKKNLEKDKYVVPIVFVEANDNKFAMFPLMSFSSAAKQIALEFVGKWSRKNNVSVRGVGFISESWVSITDKKDIRLYTGGLPMPSEDPKRKEAVVLCFWERDGEKEKTINVMQFFKKRKDNTIKWGKKNFNKDTKDTDPILLKYFWKGYFA